MRVFRKQPATVMLVSAALLVDIYLLAVNAL